MSALSCYRVTWTRNFLLVLTLSPKRLWGTKRKHTINLVFLNSVHLLFQENATSSKVELFPSSSERVWRYKPKSVQDRAIVNHWTTFVSYLCVHARSLSAKGMQYKIHKVCNTEELWLSKWVLVAIHFTWGGKQAKSETNPQIIPQRTLKPRHPWLHRIFKNTLDWISFVML